jgi:hypothetical protein
MTRWRRLRDWNDARVFDQLHQLPLARRGPTEPAWFGSVHVLQLGHEVPIPRRVPGAATRHPAAGYCSRNRARTVLEAQALQLARRCVIQGLPGSAAEFAMHHAGYPMQDPVDLSASPGIDAPGTQTSPGLFRSSSPQGCLLAHPTAWLTPHLEALMHRHGRHCEEVDARLAGTF